MTGGAKTLWKALPHSLERALTQGALSSSKAVTRKIVCRLMTSRSSKSEKLCQDGLESFLVILKSLGSPTRVAESVVLCVPKSPQLA